MSKPFNQVPVFNKDSIAISAEDFMDLQELLTLEHKFNIIKQIYYKAINDGSISFQYLEEDGTEITEDEARRRIEEYNDSDQTEV